MAVKIRLARGGSKKAPFYSIVVADVRAPRDGAFLEKVGTYNPMLNDQEQSRVVVNKERAAYWLGVGAYPTDRVAKFLQKAGIELPATVKKKMIEKEKNYTKKPSKKELKGN